MNLQIINFLAVAIIISVGSTFGADTSYAPLSIVKSRKMETIDSVVKDKQRNRDIPIRVYLPFEKQPAPVVLFSHGLGGSREGNPYLGEHWSARGYVVVFLQHLGSDDAIWKDTPILQRMAKFKQAANLQNAILRFKDVSVVIDQLEGWNKSNDSPLMGRMDLKRIGMSGHSFGAVTTQGVSGQRTARGVAIYTDKRIKAAIAMSPDNPQTVGDAKQSFGGVTIPWLLMTGTKDTALIGNATVESRLAVYPALPVGGKYELVFEGGEHEAFSDHQLPANKSKRNPNHHRAILAISTAFWDSWLRDDKAAQVWLDGTGPASILETGDRWQHK